MTQPLNVGAQAVNNELRGSAAPGFACFQAAWHRSRKSFAVYSDALHERFRASVARRSRKGHQIEARARGQARCAPLALVRKMGGDRRALAAEADVYSQHAGTSHPEGVTAGGLSALVASMPVAEGGPAH